MVSTIGLVGTNGTFGTNDIVCTTGFWFARSWHLVYASAHTYQAGVDTDLYAIWARRPCTISIPLFG